MRFAPQAEHRGRVERQVVLVVLQVGRQRGPGQQVHHAIGQRKAFPRPPHRVGLVGVEVDQHQDRLCLCDRPPQRHGPAVRLGKQLQLSRDPEGGVRRQQPVQACHRIDLVGLAAPVE